MKEYSCLAIFVIILNAPFLKYLRSVSVNNLLETTRLLTSCNEDNRISFLYIFILITCLFTYISCKKGCTNNFNINNININNKIYGDYLEKMKYNLLCNNYIWVYNYILTYMKTKYMHFCLCQWKWGTDLNFQILKSDFENSKKLESISMLLSLL